MTTPTTITISGEQIASPNDVCVCGDFRSDHKNGHGACRHNKPHDLTHGYKDCMEFRSFYDALRRTSQAEAGG